MRVACRRPAAGLSCLLLAAFLSACGNSPLLNHDTESSVAAVPGAAESGGRSLRFSDRLVAQIEWQTSARLGASQFLIRFSDPTGSPRDPARFLESKGDMRGMSMLPSIIAFERLMENGAPVPGAYIGKLTFTMRGLWFMEIQVHDGTAVRSASTAEFNVP